MWLGWVLAAAGAAILLRGLRLNFSTSPGRSAVTAKCTTKRAISESEKALYWRIRDALPDYMVLCHVELSHFIRSGDDAKLAKRLQNMSMQFIIARNDGSPLVAIELLQEQSKPDVQAFKRYVMHTAGVAYVRLAHFSVSAEDLRMLIRKTESKAFEFAPDGTGALLSDSTGLS